MTNEMKIKENLQLDSDKKSLPKEKKINVDSLIPEQSENNFTSQSKISASSFILPEQDIDFKPRQNITPEDFFKAINSLDLPDVTKMIRVSNLMARDSKGNTALHLAARTGNAKIIKLLLDEQAKTSTVNDAFETPLAIFIQEIQNNSISEFKSKFKEGLILLLEHHPQVDRVSINTCLSYLFQDENQLEKQKELIDRFSLSQPEYKRALIDFLISQLTGIHIQQLIHSKKINLLHKYIGQIYSYKGSKTNASGNSTTLEYMDPVDFLALRIRSFFTILNRLYNREISDADLPDFSPGDNQKDEVRKELISLLRIEIFVELQSLLWYKTCLALGKLRESDKDDALAALAKNIGQAINHLPDDEELAVITGWDVHTIYVHFIANEENIVVRVDNLGAGRTLKHPNKDGLFHSIDRARLPKKANPKRKQHDDDTYLHPAILGRLKKSDFLTEGQGIDYLIGLLKSEWLPESAALKRIYHPEKIKWMACDPAIIEQMNFYSNKKQTSNNCTAKCHQVGLQIRLSNSEFYPLYPKQRKIYGHKVYRWVREKEHQCIDPKESKLKNLKELWTHFHKMEEPPPITKTLRELLNLHHKHGRFGLLPGDRNNFNRVYQPQEISFKPKPFADKKSEKMTDAQETKNCFSSANISKKTSLHSFLEDLFSETIEKTCYLISDSAGKGKTAFCQHLTLEWSLGELWADKFSAVIYISLKKLNSYPKKQYGDFYSLLEIFRREYSGSHAFTDKEIREEIINSPRALWIIDGVDERPHCLELNPAVELLMQQPRVFLTSRSGFRFNIPIDFILELAPLKEPQIEQYITDYFKLKPTITTENEYFLLNFLHAHPSLFELAQTPALLEMICTAWANTSENLLKIERSTQLYEVFVNNLLKDHADDREKILQLIKELAFFGIHQNCKAIVRKDHLQAIFPMGYHGNQKQGEQIFTKILKIGFLRPIGEINQDFRQNDYEYMHPSFQEFFAAHYIRSFLSPSDTREKRLISWLSTHKYEPILAPVISYVSTLVGPTEWSKLYGIIDGSPREPIGFHHFQLIMRILRIADKDFNPPELKSLSEQAKKQFLKLLKKDPFRNPNLIFCSEELQFLIELNPTCGIQFLIEFLEDKAQQIVRNAIISLSLAGPILVTEKAIQGLMTKLSTDPKIIYKQLYEREPEPSAYQHRLSDIRFSRAYAAKALRFFDAKAAKPEILSSLVKIVITEDSGDDYMESIESLKELGSHNTTVSKAVAKTLISDLDSDDTEIVETTLRALQYLGPAAASSESIHALNKCLQSPDCDIRKRTISTLGKMREAADEISIRELIKIAEWEPELDKKTSSMRQPQDLTLPALSALEELSPYVTEKLKNQILGILNTKKLKNQPKEIIKANELIAQWSQIAPSVVDYTALNECLKLLKDITDRMRQPIPILPQLLAGKIGNADEDLGFRILSLIQKWIEADATKAVPDLIPQLSDICSAPIFNHKLAIKSAIILSQLEKIGISQHSIKVWIYLSSPDYGSNFISKAERNSTQVALSKLGAQHANNDLIFSLISLLGDDASTIRNKSACVLRNIDPETKRTKSIIVNVFHHPKTDKVLVARVLGELKPTCIDPSIINMLKQLVLNREDKISSEAVKSIGKLGHSAIIQTMDALIENLDNIERRVDSARTLAKLGEALTTYPFFSALIDRLDKEQYPDKLYAVEILHCLGPSVGTKDVIAKLINLIEIPCASTENVKLKILAIETLAEIGPLAASNQTLKTIGKALTTKDLHKQAVNTLVELLEYFIDSIANPSPESEPRDEKLTEEPIDRILFLKTLFQIGESWENNIDLAKNFNELVEHITPEELSATLQKESISDLSKQTILLQLLKVGDVESFLRLSFAGLIANEEAVNKFTEVCFQEDILIMPVTDEEKLVGFKFDDNFIKLNPEQAKHGENFLINLSKYKETGYMPPKDYKHCFFSISSEKPSLRDLYLQLIAQPCQLDESGLDRKHHNLPETGSLSQPFGSTASLGDAEGSLDAEMHFNPLGLPKKRKYKDDEFENTFEAKPKKEHKKESLTSDSFLFSNTKIGSSSSSSSSVTLFPRSQEKKPPGLPATHTQFFPPALAHASLPTLGALLEEVRELLNTACLPHAELQRDFLKQLAKYKQADLAKPPTQIQQKELQNMRQTLRNLQRQSSLSQTNTSSSAR